VPFRCAAIGGGRTVPSFSRITSCPSSSALLALSILARRHAGSARR
jgi:hypothetical protein